MKYIIFGLAILFLIFTINIISYYKVYNDFKKDKIIELKVEVQNIYKKEDFDVLKLSNKNLTFFTSISKNQNIKKLDNIKIAIITRNIFFLEFLKGFYANNIYIEKLPKINNFKNQLYENINSQHSSNLTKDLFNALFLAVPISVELRDITNIYGISHLLALSGFHLGLILFISYWIIYFIYSPIHQKFVPYRNKKFDALLISGVLIFSYLIFTNIVPSLLRAFVMFAVGLYLLRNDIKIFSFTNLLLVALIILALFPKYAFSVSLWFSLAGVFYILLYIKYFSEFNKYLSFLFFNIWIFFALNPIILYFFDIVSFAQFLSAPLTLLFTLFYPFEIVLHILKLGDLIDEYILWLFNLEFEIKNYLTNIYFLILFLTVSVVAIYKKIAFYILNILILFFNVYVYFIV